MRNHIAVERFTSGMQIQEPPSRGSAGQELDVLVVSVAAVTVVSLLVVRVVELQSPLSVKIALTLHTKGPLKRSERKAEKSNSYLSLYMEPSVLG